MDALTEYITTQMRLHEPVSLEGPATEEDIVLIEQALEVKLPDDYRWFLKTYGSAKWPYYVFGVVGGFEEPFNVVCETRYERSSKYTPLPSHLIPICNDGFGNFYCLNIAALNGGLCPVVFWDHDAGGDQTPEFTHASFLEWLAWMIADQIQIEAEE